MSITENNKLIAEFMGFEVLYRPQSNGFVEISSTELCDVDDMEYDTSWDWLMPVAIKCINEAERIDESKWVKSIEYVAFTSIGKLYREVVEFINYYNKQNNER